MASTVVVGDVLRDFVFAGVGNGTACMYGLIDKQLLRLNGKKCDF